MNNLNRWIPGVLLVSVLCLLLINCGVTLAGAGEIKAISDAESNTFFRAIKCSFKKSFVDQGMQFFRVGAKHYNLDIPDGVGIAVVTPDKEQAVQDEMYRRELAEKPSEHSARIGNEYMSWFKSDGGMVLFRRKNMVVMFMFKGQLSDADALALAIDNRLMAKSFSVVGR